MTSTLKNKDPKIDIDKLARELPTIPKDLQLKVGTKEEAAWTNIRDRTKENTQQNNIQNLINEQVIALAERKIKEEQDKK